MKRIMILLTAALLVIGSSLNAQPVGKGMAPGAGFGPGFNGNPPVGFQPGVTPLNRMQLLLDLTDEQAAKISDIRFEQQNLVLDLRNQIQKNRLVVRKMMTDNKIDQDKLLSITTENSKLREKISTSRVKMWLDIYNLLDDTQKAKWSKTFAQFGQAGNFSRAGKAGRAGGRGMGMMSGRGGRMMNGGGCIYGSPRGMGMGFAY